MRSPAKSFSAVVRRLNQPGAAGRLTALAIPYGWLALFFLLPLLIVVKISVSESVMGIPPYEPILRFAEDAKLQIHLTFSNFGLLLRDNMYVVAYLNSVKIAAISTLISVVIGFLNFLASSSFIFTVSAVFFCASLR